jgi:hypothetical protein
MQTVLLEEVITKFAMVSRLSYSSAVSVSLCRHGLCGGAEYEVPEGTSICDWATRSMRPVRHNIIIGCSMSLEDRKE